ncbi:MAG: hypothetical protein IT435_09285 [Phycisphaerales bacterium]|nr:hypothetical protein [Phycisphaerales bacterium]
MVAIAVVALLMTLLIAVATRSSATTIKATCAINIRSTGQVLEAYAVSYRESLPFGGYTLTWQDFPEVGRIGLGSHFGLGFGAWSFLLPEEWSGRFWNAGLRCPQQPMYDGMDGPQSWNAVPTPQYCMTFSAWLDEGYFADGWPAHAPPVVEPHRVSDVTFPSSKGYLIENPGFCVDGPRAMKDIYENRQTFVQPVSTLMFDGSVVRKSMRDMNQFRNSLPVLVTRSGIRGRDL